uniref:Ig-like domain-containing protein n=1 Tax=Branchiostoma floridae TaxID=7739 RepID=C3XX44_BRAFL|eukprot:XP_002611294.1 hypothetical protein BRAFLDRAFT_73312 [Branchiostoma floridae]
MTIPSLVLLGLLIVVGFAGSSSRSDLDRCSRRFGNPPTAITCTRSGALSDIPAELPEALRSLVIKFQTIKTIGRGKLPGLPNLRVLTIHSSSVVEVEVGCFDTVPNLTNLDLSMNKIRKLEVGTFRGLRQLKYLNLALNHLVSIDNGTFSELQKIETLDLSINCLQRIPSDIWRLKSLQEFTIMDNIIQQLSLGDLVKFQHNEGMNMFGGRLICDCRLREIKKWITRLGRSRLDVMCTDENRKGKWLSSFPLDRLTCPPPLVSVTRTNAVGIPGKGFLTCQANCLEKLHFSWLLPNGNELSSTSEYSRQRASERMLHCRRIGSDVRVFEETTTCYSVLNLTASQNGTYTCMVTGNHAKSANASAILNLGHIQLPDVVQYKTTPQESIKTTPRSMVVFSETTTLPGHLKSNVALYEGIAAASGVGVVLVLAALIRKIRMRNEEEPARRRRGQDKDVRHVSNQGDDSNIDGLDHSSRPYENDDETLNEEDGARATYENDDQFRDPYENDGAEKVSYEIDDQFSNQDMRSCNKRRRHKTRGSECTPDLGKTPKTFDAVEADNLPKPRTRKELRASMCRVTVRGEGLGGGEYDNEKRPSHQGRASKSRRQELCDSVAFAVPGRVGHYDNEGRLVEFLKRTQETHDVVTSSHDSKEHVLKKHRHDTSGLEAGTEDTEGYITVRGDDTSEPGFPYKRRTNNPYITKASADNASDENDAAGHECCSFPGDFKTDHYYVTLPADIDYVTFPSDTEHKTDDYQALKFNEHSKPNDYQFLSDPESPKPDDYQPLKFPKNSKPNDYQSLTVPESPKPNDYQALKFPENPKSGDYQALKFHEHSKPDDYQFISDREGSKPDDYQALKFPENSKPNDYQALKFPENPKSGDYQALKFPEHSKPDDYQFLSDREGSKPDYYQPLKFPECSKPNDYQFLAVTESPKPDDYQPLKFPKTSKPNDYQFLTVPKNSKPNDYQFLTVPESPKPDDYQALKFPEN